MPELLNVKTGETVKVKQAELQGLIESGEYDFAPEGKYKLRNREGVAVEISGRDAKAAILDMGMSLEDPTERFRELEEESEREYYEGQKGRTIVEGLARGATAGLIDLTWSDKEGVGKRRAHNAPYATFSELTGAVLPAIVSGGAGLGAGIAKATPAGALARGATRIAGEGSVARAAVGYGLEGAAFSSGQFISDVALGDKELSGEAFVNAMKEGALWGGGAGAAFTAVGKGARKLAGRARAQAEAVGETAGDIAGAEKTLIEGYGKAGGPPKPGAIEAALAKDAQAEAKAAARAEREAARADKTVRYGQPEKELRLEEQYLGREAKAAARDAEKEAAAAARAEVDAEIADLERWHREMMRNDTGVIKASKVLPKSQRGKKAASRAKDDFDSTLAGHKKIGDEIEELASKEVEVASLRGDHAYAKDMNAAIEKYRNHRARFEDWLAGGGLEHQFPGARTQRFERNFLESAREAAGRLGVEATDEIAKKAARQYGHGIAMRRGRAWQAKKAGLPHGARRAAAREAFQVPPESEMFKAMEEIASLERRLAEPRTLSGAKAVEEAKTLAGRARKAAKTIRDKADDTVAGRKARKVADEIEEAAKDIESTLAGKKAVVGKGTVAGKKAAKAPKDTVAGRKLGQAAEKLRDTYGWTIKPAGQKNLIDALVEEGALGPQKRYGTLVAPGGKLPLKPLKELEAPVVEPGSEIFTFIKPGAAKDTAAGFKAAKGTPPKGMPAVDLTQEMPAGVPTMPAGVVTMPYGQAPTMRLPQSEIPTVMLPPGKVTQRITAEDVRLAQGLDVIEGYEKAQDELFDAVSAKLPPERAQQLAEDVKAYKKAKAKVEGKKGRFDSFKDALGAMEVLQTLGVPGVPDVDKIPVIGPLLGAYAKYRFAKRALQKGGYIRKTPEAAVAEKVAQTRDRIADGIESFFKSGKAAAAVPAVAVMLNSKLFDDNEKKYRGDKKKTDKAVSGLLEAQRLYAKREQEIRAARAQGTDAFRKKVLVGDEELQGALEGAHERKMKYLEENLIKRPEFASLNPLGLEGNWKPSPAELYSFARKLRAADDFETIVADLKARRLTPEAVEAVKAVYPKLYNELRSGIIDMAANSDLTKIDYGARVQLSILFEAPVDPMMTDKFIAFMADEYARKDEEGGPSTPPPPPTSFAGPGLAELAQTGLDRRAGK